MYQQSSPSIARRVVRAIGVIGSAIGRTEYSEARLEQVVRSRRRKHDKASSLSSSMHRSGLPSPLEPATPELRSSERIQHDPHTPSSVTVLQSPTRLHAM